MELDPQENLEPAVQSTIDKPDSQAIQGLNIDIDDAINLAITSLGEILETIKNSENDESNNILSQQCYDHFFERSKNIKVSLENKQNLIILKFKYQQDAIRNNKSLSETEREKQLAKVEDEFLINLATLKEQITANILTYPNFLISTYINPLAMFDFLNTQNNETFKANIEFIDGTRKELIDFIMREFEEIAKRENRQVEKFLEMIKDIHSIENQLKNKLDHNHKELQQELNDIYEGNIEPFESAEYLIEFDQLIFRYYVDLEAIYIQAHYVRFTALKNALLDIDIEENILDDLLLFYPASTEEENPPSPEAAADLNEPMVYNNNTNPGADHNYNVTAAVPPENQLLGETERTYSYVDPLLRFAAMGGSHEI